MCGGESIAISRPVGSTLQELIDYLLDREDLYVSACRPHPLRCLCRLIKKPSLSFGPKPLYLQAPPQLEAATRLNLEKPLSELFGSGDTLSVTDAGLPFSLQVVITFE